MYTPVSYSPVSRVGQCGRRIFTMDGRTQNIICTLYSITCSLFLVGVLLSSNEKNKVLITLESRCYTLVICGKYSDAYLYLVVKAHHSLLFSMAGKPEVDYIAMIMMKASVRNCTCRPTFKLETGFFFTFISSN